MTNYKSSFPHFILHTDCHTQLTFNGLLHSTSQRVISERFFKPLSVRIVPVCPNLYLMQYFQKMCRFKINANVKFPTYYVIRLIMLDNLLKFGITIHPYESCFELHPNEAEQKTIGRNVSIIKVSSDVFPIIVYRLNDGETRKNSIF